MTKLRIEPAKPVPDPNTQTARPTQCAFGRQQVHQTDYATRSTRILTTARWQSVTITK